MSIETLQLPTAEYMVGRAIGLSDGELSQIAELQQPRIIDLGAIALQTERQGEQKLHVVRAVCGPVGYLNKGGMRALSEDAPADIDIVEQAGMLAGHMLDKNMNGIRDYRGRRVIGGKTLIDGRGVKLTPNDKVQLCYNIGLASYERGETQLGRSVPASDMNTNKPAFMNSYKKAVEYASALDNHGVPDPFSRASITGKSVEHGGNPFRPEATGAGVHFAAVKTREPLGFEPDDEVLVTVGGGGNVGGTFAYFASQNKEHKFIIRGMNDRGASLFVESSDRKIGMKITEDMKNNILDNADFASDERYLHYRGNKLEALRDTLIHDQPELEKVLRLTANENDIFDVETDIFCPASADGVITKETASHLVRAGTKAIVEGGNGTMTDGGKATLRNAKVLLVDGEEANRGGVLISMRENIDNVLEVLEEKKPFTYGQSMELLKDNMYSSFDHARAIAEAYGRPNDIEFAVRAISIAGKADLFNIRTLDLAT